MHVRDARRLPGPNRVFRAQMRVGDKLGIFDWLRFDIFRGSDEAIPARRERSGAGNGNRV
jgi:hypothetical protein